ncbi:glycogen synthase GlgA [Paracidovorax citrulli]
MNANVLFVAAEAMPLAKTGGLGDVVSGLARSLQQRGLNVTILMPGYPQAMAGAVGLRSLGALRLEEYAPALALPPGHSAMRLMVGRLPDSQVQVALLDCPSLYDRAGTLYTDATGRDYADNAQRFAALAHAATAIAAGRTPLPVPSVVHAHDWHAGLTPLLMRIAGLSTPSVMTIHNLAFQGLFPLCMAPHLGIPQEYLNHEGIEFYGQMNFLKAGLLYAHRITTVSRHYAEEVLTPRFGHGLEGVLQARVHALGAIPNGIDTKTWDPAHDDLLPRSYTPSAVTGKRACKAELQRRFGLPVDAAAPLVAMGSRLTHQKMADVALHSIEQALQADSTVQFAVLGCGDHGIEHGFEGLAARYPDRVAVAIGYREETAHLLHAGADILLHGSRFEPFGLTPVYAMRYGTIPIVSKVGGLVDTVRDAGEGPVPAPGATGFVFEGEEPRQMTDAIVRALSWLRQSKAWRALQRTGMQAQWGWEGPAAQYVSLYAALSPVLAAEHALELAAQPQAERTARKAPRRTEDLVLEGAAPTRRRTRSTTSRRGAAALPEALPATLPTATA